MMCFLKDIFCFSHIGTGTVSIRAAYELDRWGSIPGRGKRSSCIPQYLDRLWGPIQPPNQWVPGVFSLVIKLPGHEANHLPLFSVKIKIGGAVPPSPFIFMAWCLAS
jgi:hypothetical protein